MFATNKISGHTLEAMDGNSKILTARNERRLARKAGPSAKRAGNQLKLTSGRSSVFDPHPPGSLFFSPIEHRGPVYLYLEKPEYATAWIEGGQVPIFPARKYLADERIGVITPDEIHQRSMEFVDDGAFYKFVGPGAPSAGTNFMFFNCSVHDETGTRLLHGASHYKSEDAYVLCFSTLKSVTLMKRLGKALCLRIDDPNELRRSLDRQIGQAAHHGKVGYTFGDERGHFLKAMADSWQVEYRCVWVIEGTTPIKVDVPPGIAHLEF